MTKRERMIQDKVNPLLGLNLLGWQNRMRKFYNSFSRAEDDMKEIVGFKKIDRLGCMIMLPKDTINNPCSAMILNQKGT